MLNKIWKVVADILALCMIIIAVMGVCFTEVLSNSFEALAGIITIPLAIALLVGAFVVHACGSIPEAIDRKHLSVNVDGCNNKKEIEGISTTIHAYVQGGFEGLYGKMDDIRDSIEMLSKERKIEAPKEVQSLEVPKQAPVEKETKAMFLNVDDVMGEEPEEKVSKTQFFDEAPSECIGDSKTLENVKQHRMMTEKKAAEQAEEKSGDKDFASTTDELIEMFKDVE